MIGLSTGTSIHSPIVLAAQGDGLSLIRGIDVIAADTVIL